ncbi:hypothetical protein II906_12195 [bacterium]|nr:hypothetical protein [bacterium]
MTEQDNDIQIIKNSELQNLFEADDFVKSKLCAILNSNKNTIVVTHSNNNRNEIINCLRELISSDIKSDILHNPAEIAFSHATKIIIPAPLNTDIAKIFEQILTDTRSYIFSLPVRTFDNLLESIKILISVHYTNLSPSSVEHMIGVCEPILIFINKNSNNKYQIENIVKTEYIAGKLNLKNIMDKTSSQIPEEVEPVVEQEIKELEVQAAEELYKEEAKEVLAENIQKPEVTKKVNKYKLLKEKFQKKKEM